MARFVSHAFVFFSSQAKGTTAPFIPRLRSAGSGLAQTLVERQYETPGRVRSACRGSEEGRAVPSKKTDAAQDRQTSPQRHHPPQEKQRLRKTLFPNFYRTSHINTSKLGLLMTKELDKPHQSILTPKRLKLSTNTRGKIIADLKN